MIRELKMGRFLAGIVFYFLKKTILKNTKFDVIGKNEPIKKMDLILVPCCMLIGSQDELIDLEEFKEMFRLCRSERKTLRFMENTSHGDFRNDVDLFFVRDFLNEILN